MEAKILSVQNLNKYYGDFHAVKDVSFDVSKGEIVGFIGPNGSGKTTVMKCINSLLIPTSGSVTVYGSDIVKEREKALSYQASLIESPALYTDLKGIDNLKLFAHIRDVSKSRIDEIIKIINIGDFLNQRVSRYSLGMKQRLALGIVLLSNPKFIILDEPMNGLDQRGVYELRILLETIAKNGTAILFSSHQLGEIEKVAHRIISIKEGRLIPFKRDLVNQSSYEIDFEGSEYNLIEKVLIISGINTASVNDQTLHVSMNNDDCLNAILKLMLDSNLIISDVKQTSISVEDLYLEMFGD